LGRTPQYIKLFSARSTSLLDVFPITLGNVPQVAQELDNSLPKAFHLLIYGDVLSVVVILG